MKKLLFISGSAFQVPIILKAKKMGLYVGSIDINGAAPASKYADEFFQCSICDNEKVLEIARKFKPDGIICGACDTAVPASAYVCEKLGLVGHTKETAYKATNKWAMIKAFEEHGVEHPKFQLVKKDEIDKCKIDMPFTVISKPTDAAASRGVCKIECQEDLYFALCQSSAAGTSGDVLIEEYLEGPEVSVEVVVIGDKPTVLQITDKVTSGAPHFYELGHAQPSSLPENVKSQISDLAERAVMALGIKNSPAHVEIKATKDGPKMVELGARMGGDYISTHLVDNSVVGVNMSEIAIRLALGEEPVLPEYKNSDDIVAVKFIPAKEGTVKEITGIEKVLSSESVVKAEAWCEIGKHYKAAVSNSERFGYVIAKGKTREEAFENCEKAVREISIVIE